VNVGNFFTAALNVAFLFLMIVTLDGEVLKIFLPAKNVLFLNKIDYVAY
jgi:hypothetical protein